MGGTSEYDPAPNSERTRSNCMGLPPGFRFYPTDQEILSHYLFPKIVDCRFTARAMGEVDLNRSEPWELPGKAKMGETDFLYFFCQRDRKYPTGMRTNRATGAGYWKATGKDKDINEERNNTLVGMKKTLVFYMGRAPKGVKTNWVMHEYRLEGKASYWKLPRSSPKDWVVCRVFHKSTGIKRDLTAQESLQTAESSHGYDSNRNAVVPMLLQSLMESPHYLNTSTDGLHLDCGLANYTPDKLDMSQDVAILKNNPPLINTYSMYPSHRILFPSQQAPPVPNPPLPASPTLNGNQCSSTGEQCYAAIGDETAFGAIGDETAFRAIGDETAFQQGIRTKCKMEEQYPEQSHIRMVLRDHTVTGDPRNMWTFQNN